MIRISVVVSVLFGIFTLCYCSPPRCIDLNGNAVDWYAMFKANKNSSHPDTRVQGGLAYSYYDETMSGETLRLASDDLSSPTCAVGRTVQQLYSNHDTSTYGWIMYNDEWPSGKKVDYKAHAKGVLYFTDEGGFWLIHSIPRFPYGTKDVSTYKFPDTETIYGQSFLCLSLSSSELEKVAHQLQVYYIDIYESNMPDGLKSSMPEMSQLESGTHIGGTEMSSTVTLSSDMSHHRFTSFAKSKEWGKSLYSDLVQLSLGSDMYLETWMRPHTPNCCAPQCQYSAMNVKEMEMDGVWWIETQDHSKWGITTEGTTVCIGDINRAESQWKRGGGTVCFENSHFYRAVKNCIAEHEMC